jgi:group I intron endonuclease
MVVYKITNMINNKIYIGKTKRLRVRWLQHCKSHSHCKAISSAIQKYGAEAFKLETVFEHTCPIIVSHKERVLIKELNTMSPNGYNLTKGGEGAPHTAESKRKLSEAHKGAKNPMYGKKLSPEHKAKISASLMGRKRPQEVKDKISVGHNPKSDKNLTYRRKPNQPTPSQAS